MRVESKRRALRTKTRMMVAMTLNSHKGLPQYMDVQAKVASTGCILSCHSILSKLASEAYCHVPAIAGIDRL
jgi:hypothetical protein